MDVAEAHKILGTKSDATETDIKNAYRSRSATFHPDKFNSDSEFQKMANKKMQEINLAYEILRGRGSNSNYTQNNKSSSYSKYDSEGYDKNGFNQSGYNRSGFNKDGFNRNGYDQKGFDVNGYDKDGFDKSGYSQKGYNKSGFNKDGFNRSGYDKYGYSRKGYNRAGYDREGYDKDGFDRNGFDKYGFDKDGYNHTGYDKTGVNKNRSNTSDKTQDDTVLSKQSSRKNYSKYVAIVATFAFVIVFALIIALHGTAPSDVQGLGVAPLSISAISVSWNSSENATGYEVKVTHDESENSNIVDAYFMTDTTSRDIIDLEFDESYTVSVRAYILRDGKFHYQKGNSATVSAQTLTPLLEPTITKATAQSYNTIKISWEKVEAFHGNILYRLSASTSKDGGYKEIYSGTKLSFTYSGLKADKVYYFQVHAILSFDGMRTEAFSEVVSVKTAAKPKAVAQTPVQSTPPPKKIVPKESEPKESEPEMWW